MPVRSLTWEDVEPIRPVECRTADDVRALARRYSTRVTTPGWPSRKRVAVKKAEPPISANEAAPVEEPQRLVTRDWLFSPEQRITSRLIIGIASEFYGLTRAEICSAKRQAPLIRARYTAMFVAKHLTGRSLTEIGKDFGGRDHTTVLHALRRVDQSLDSEPALADEIESICYAIEREVGGPA